LSLAERTDYINAVKCLIAAPSKLSATQYPGAKSRFDDFVVVHINMTMHVHDTVCISIPCVFSNILTLLMTGKLLALAQILHLGIRNGIKIGVQLQRLPTGQLNFSGFPT
jgi:hypothetical protein